MATVDKFALGNPRRFGYMFVQQENSNPQTRIMSAPGAGWKRRGFVFAPDRASLRRQANVCRTRGLAADEAKDSGYADFVTALLVTKRREEDTRTEQDYAEFRHIFHHNALPREVSR